MAWGNVLGSILGAATLVAFAYLISRIVARCEFGERDRPDTGLELWVPEGFEGDWRGQPTISGGGRPSKSAGPSESDTRHGSVNNR